MIFHSFPALLPDEHVSSLIYRWFQRTRYKSIESFVQQHLGMHFFDLPRKPWLDIYRHCADTMEPCCSAPDFIRWFTNVNDYSIFSGDRVSGSTVNEIFGSLSKLRFQNGLHVSTDKGWRFCPVCAINDKRLYGTTYLRVSHQRYYKRICSIHNVVLNYVEPHYFSLPPTNTEGVLASCEVIKCDQALTNLFKKLKSLSASERRTKILCALQQKLGFHHIPYNKSVKQKRIIELHAVLAQRYNESAIAGYFEWPSMISGHYPLVAQKGLSWMLSPSQNLHPMYYLMFIYLFLSSSELEMVMDAPLRDTKTKNPLPWIIAPIDPAQEILRHVA